MEQRTLDLDIPSISSAAWSLIETNKANVAGRLRTVERRVREFSGAVRNRSLLEGSRDPVRPVVVYRPRVERDYGQGFVEMRTTCAREAAAEAIAQLEYRAGDEVNESVKCYGVIGVPPDLVNLARIVNRAKGELREAVRPVAGRRVKVPGRDENGRRVLVVRELTTLLLRVIQHANYNLLACYRELPVIEGPVQRVRLMVTRTRSVERKTVAQLLEILADEPGIIGMRDFNRLTEYVEDRGDRLREYLARPNPYYWRMRAKVALRQTSAGRQRQRIVSAELPLLLPMTARTPDPVIDGPTPPDLDRKRPPPHMEEAPFVESLGFHRMLPEYRKQSA